LAIGIHATDLDSDRLTYSVRSATAGAPLPQGSLDSGTGLLSFAPSPRDLGSYQVEVLASDGVLTGSRTFTLTVIADAVGTTRVSGRVLDVNQSAIPGIVVEIGGVNGLTQSDGSFHLDLGDGPLVTETLKVRGENFFDPTRPSVKYPFIAEKLPFMFGREVYRGVSSRCSPASRLALST